MKTRIVAAFAAWLPALLLASSCRSIASAVQCVSPDPAVTCHRTIQDALGVAAPGENVVVHPGTYVENVTVDKTGVQIVGQGAWPGQVVVKSVDGVVVSLNAPQVTLRNVSVAGGDTGIAVRGGGATIDGVLVRDSRTGIAVFSDGVRVIGSSVQRIGGPGIKVTGKDFAVLSSLVQRTGGTGISVDGDGALVKKCRILDCGDDGVKIHGGGASVLENVLLVAGGNLVRVDGPGPRIGKNRLEGGRASAIDVHADAPIVIDNWASDCDTGIDVHCASCSGALVADNTAGGIYDCPGFYAWADSGGLVVRNNTSRDNSDEGFLLRGQGILAHDNTAIENGLDGIHVESPSTGTRLRDNAAHSNARDGIRIDGGVTDTGVSGNRAKGNGGVDLFDAGSRTSLGTGDDRNFFETSGP